MSFSLLTHDGQCAASLMSTEESVGEVKIESVRLGTVAAWQDSALRYQRNQLACQISVFEFQADLLLRIR